MIKRFFKDTLIYALPMFLARAIGLLLLPIYTRQLGPVDFGFIEFVAAGSAILLTVLPLEINQAVGRLLPESQSNSYKYKIINTAFWFTFFIFLIFGLFVYLAKFMLLSIFNLPNSYSQYAGLICLSFLITALINLLQVKFRFLGQSIASVAINLAVILSNLMFVLYFSSNNTLGLWQYFLSQILSGLIGVLIGLIILILKYQKYFSFRDVDIFVLKDLLNYSSPIVLSSIGIVMAASFDRLMIGSYLGMQELGYYAVATRLSAIVSIFYYVISTAMTPVVYREHKKPEIKTLIASICKLTCCFSITLLVIIIFYSRSIVTLFAGDEFTVASEYLFYVIASSVLSGLCIFFLGMDINKKTKLLSKINLSFGVLNILISFIFIPLYGVFGAIAVMLISSFFRLLGYVYFSQRLYKIPLVLWPYGLFMTFLISLNVYLNV